MFHDRIGNALKDAADSAGDLIRETARQLDPGPIGISLDQIARETPIVGALWNAIDPEKPEDIDNGALLTYSGVVRGLPVIYGNARTGGNLVFERVTGQNNEVLHQVIVWGEGKIASVDQVYIDDIPITDSRFSGKAYRTDYLGDDNQTADALLVASVPEWTTEHAGKGVAYSYFRFYWDKDVFRGRPRITADISGKLVYDPRTGLTVFSKNPALIVRDYLTSTRYGLGISASDIDDQSISIAADYCDTLVTPYNGATTKQPLWEIGGVLDTDKELRQNIINILKSARLFLIFSGGKYKIIADKDEQPVIDIDERIIVGQWKVSKGGKKNVLNKVEVSYINPDNKHKKDVAVFDDQAIRSSEDNGNILSTRVDAKFVNNIYRAKDIASLILKQSRQSISIDFTTTLDAIDVLPGNVVSITHSSTGWVQKPFRVTSVKLLDIGLVQMSAYEHDPSVYVRSPGDQVQQLPDVGLPDPTTVGSPANVSGTATESEAVLNTEGTRVYRILTSWTAPADAYVIGYEVEVRSSASSTWSAAGATHSRDDTSIYISPVKDGESYYVRVRSKNAIGVASAWEYSQAITVQGKAGAPSAPTQIVVTPVQQGLQISVPDSAMPQDADLAAIIFWWHTVNDRSLVPGDTQHRISVSAVPGKSAHANITVPPGTKIYAWAMAIDTAGNVSQWYPAQTSGISGTSQSAMYLDGQTIDALQPAEAGATLGADWDTNIVNRPKRWRLISNGIDAENSGNYDSRGVYNESGTKVYTQNRSYGLIEFDAVTGNFYRGRTFDVYGNAVRNYAQSSEYVAGWEVDGSGTVVTRRDDVLRPDGIYGFDVDATVYQVFLPASEVGRVKCPISSIVSGNVSIGVWLKTTDGSSKQITLQLRETDGSTTYLSSTVTVTGVWQFFSVSGSIASKPVAPRLWVHKQTTSLPDTDIFVWGACCRQAASIGQDQYAFSPAGAVGRTCGQLAAQIRLVPKERIIAITTYDEPNAYRTAQTLPQAIKLIGGSRAVFENPNFVTRAAYILVGKKGIGQGNGIEVYRGDSNNNPESNIELSFSIKDGLFQGSTGTPDVEAGADNTSRTINLGLNMSVAGSSIYSGKGSFSSVNNGYWIGVDTDDIAKFNFGDANNFIKWDGSDLIAQSIKTSTGQNRVEINGLGDNKVSVYIGNVLSATFGGADDPSNTLLWLGHQNYVGRCLYAETALDTAIKALTKDRNSPAISALSDTGSIPSGEPGPAALFVDSKHTSSSGNLSRYGYGVVINQATSTQSSLKGGIVIPCDADTTILQPTHKAAGGTIWQSYHRALWINTSIGLDTYSNISDAKETTDWVKISGGGTLEIFEEVKALGTDGGSITAGTWTTRIFNSKYAPGDNKVFSLLNADGSFYLSPGYYMIRVTAPGYRIGHHKLRLFNVTQNSQVFEGYNALSNSSGTYIQMRAELETYFRSNGETFRIEHISSVSVSGNGLGLASNVGSQERYAFMMLWRVSA